MISNEIKSKGTRTRRRIPKGGFVGRATMKLSLLTVMLLTSVRGNVWPNHETMNIPSSSSAPIVEVRADSPTLSTLILPPKRDPIPLTRFANDKIEPIVVDAVATPRASSSAIIISPESRTTRLELSKNAARITGGTDGNGNIVGAIERNDGIASDDNASKKLFLCGSLGDELIVSRPGSGSVFIKGASKVAIIEDVQNSVIVCPPGTNLTPPSAPEENTRTHELDLERKLPTTTLAPAPVALIAESSKTLVSVDPPIELKDYLVPPYSYWQK